MRAAWIIARKDLALRLRDRSVIIIGLIAPLALAFIFNLVFGGSFNDVGENIEFQYGVVDEDGGPIGAAFIEVMEGLATEGLVELTSYPSAAAGRDAADRGEVDASFLLPVSMSADVMAGRDATLEVTGNVDAPTATDVAGSIAERFAAGLRSANTAAVTALTAGVIGPDDLAAAAEQASRLPPPVVLGPVSTEVRQLDAATYFVAGLSIFFMFFVAGLGVTSMLEERRDGTLARLLAAPIGRSSILGGKSLTSVLIGLVSMTVLVIASRFLMGATWGEPLGVALLVGSAVLAVVAIMSLAGGAAKTAEQAANLQSIVAVSAAMLGGTFVPIGDPNSFLGRLSFITPNAWFIRGLGDLAGGSVSDVLPATGVLLAMALVFGAASLVVVRKVVEL